MTSMEELPSFFFLVYRKRGFVGLETTRDVFGRCTVRLSVIKYGPSI